ncbi:MAG TPA: cytochrome B [Gemmatimonadetes bacterium]|nr:cytochrome B [Gemmatimonadota bacterium]HBV05412.1 cytochrome B [Gemmatimonadota bacterium]|tara:strand:- start:22850 stop:23731 length:882 start_codon:yes stop_codon:yes gene_type:complete
MDLWRRAANPWGQDVLIGVSWDLMWGATVIAVAFVIGHALWVRMRKEEAHEPPEDVPAGIPEKIERHSFASRAFHWVMSIAMLVLLVTAFVPVMGLQFNWVDLHWQAGVLLILTVVYHVIHAIGWQDFWSMFHLGLSEGIATLRHVLSSKAPAPPKAGKYPFDHRMYHHVIVVVSLAAIITGVLMMVRIDTPLWTRNPYLFSDTTWGVMYVVHGLSGVSLILLVASHIYFALRPEKRWITWSMVRGWIDREHYLEHFDPAKWVVTDGGMKSGDGTAPGTGAVAEQIPSAKRED